MGVILATRVRDKLRETFTDPEDWRDAREIANLIFAEKNGHPIVIILTLIIGVVAASLGSWLGEMIAGNAGSITGCFTGAAVVLGAASIISRSITRKKLQRFVYEKSSRIPIEKRVREIFRELDY